MCYPKGKCNGMRLVLSNSIPKVEQLLYWRGFKLLTFGRNTECFFLTDTLISPIFKKKKNMSRINELKKQSSLTYKIIDDIYNNIFIEWNAFQNQYDVETKNSVSKEMQSIWNKKIIDQLNSL